MADALDQSAVTAAYPKESIPRADTLYMRVHAGVAGNSKDGKPHPSWFVDKPNDGDGMSTNWCKYSDPHATRRGDGKKPAANYAVVELNVGEILDKVPAHTVCHDPVQGNQAHTLVFGDKRGGDPENRVKIARIARIVVELRCPIDSTNPNDGWHAPKPCHSRLGIS